MSTFIHSAHNFIVLLVRYLFIIAVIAFIPVPLFSFLGGDSLAQIDHNPLFDYFNHYPLTTDSVIEHVYTNVYIAQGTQKPTQYQIDNAVLWADALAYRLSEEGVPVVRHAIIGKKDFDFSSVKSYHAVAFEESFLPPETQNLLLKLKIKFESLLPIGPLTEDARQWIILSLNTNEKTIKKQLKSLVSDYPNDNFLVLTKNPVTLNKKTLQLALPNFNTKQAKKALSEGLKITQAQAQILLVENQKSLWALNHQKGQAQQISFKSLLGENYRPLNDLPSKAEKILAELCQEGKVKVSGKKSDLGQFGVIIKNKNYQWQNQNARINYQLQKETLCGKAWIDVETETVETPESEETQNDSKSQVKDPEPAEVPAQEPPQAETPQNAEN